MSRADNSGAGYGGRTFTAKGKTVHVDPITVKKPEGGSTITLGFPFCDLSDYVDEQAAVDLAEHLSRATPAPAGWQDVDTAEIARLSIAGGLFEHVSGKYGIVWEGVEQPEEYQFRQRAIEKLGQFRADAILNMLPTAPAEGAV